MTSFWQLLAEQWAAQSFAELVAVILAIGYVWLAARQNIWCWPCAFISTGIYTWLFWEVTLPFNAALNGYYLLMALYGWWTWKGQDDEALTVTTRQWTWHGPWILGLLVVSLVFGFSAHSLLDAELLYLDALVTVFSVFTTVLVAHKVLENWLYWMLINSAAAYLYLSKGLVLTGLLFGFYIAFSVYGYLSWKKHSSHSPSAVTDAA